MAYTNSSLICHTHLSPYNSGLRTHPISKITIHHMAGNLSVETCGNVFQTSESSSNYGVGTDGRMAMYVEEKNRSWASCSSWNDNRAVTIEVANCEYGGNWRVSDKALASLIKLCVDICKRNGMPKLEYTGDKNGSLTIHSMFAATACPGPYLKSKLTYIANEVTRQLTGKAPSNDNSSTSTEMYRVGTAWKNGKCVDQKGAYRNLSGAKETCNKYADHYVFNSNGTKVHTSTKSSNKVSIPDFIYRVKAGGKWHSEIKNLEDYAGVPNVPITDIAIKATKGSVKYRVHVKGGDWLGWITKYDINDYYKGYAGNGKPIDAIQVYYYTPEDVKKAHGYLRAQYRISPTTSDNYWGWQYDTETSNGQDGYAGYFGTSIDKLQLTLSK